MNKKWTELFSSYGMEIEKNLAYGKIKDYEVNASVQVFDNASPLKIHISCYATDEQKRNIESGIRNLALKYFRMSFSEYGLLLGFNDLTVGRLINRLPEVLDKIFAVLSENGALNSEYCPVCGKPLDKETSKKCNIDGLGVTIDNDCVATINTVIKQENKDFDEAPNNYLKGFLGAFIGGLAGVAVAVLLYVADFVSAISAIVSVVAGTFLYKKFHGKQNKMMIVIVSLTTLVLMAATVPAIYIVAAGISASNAGLSISAIDAFRIVMMNAEYARWFYSDLALILLFSAIGIGLEIFVLARQIKRKKTIE